MFAAKAAWKQFRAIPTFISPRRCGNVVANDNHCVQRNNETIYQTNGIRSTVTIGVSLPAIPSRAGCGSRTDCAGNRAEGRSVPTLARNCFIGAKIGCEIRFTLPSVQQGGLAHSPSICLTSEV